MRAGSFFGSLVLAILLQNGAVWAEDCGPLRQINAVDLVAAPNRALVPVSINGIPIRSCQRSATANCTAAASWI